MVIPKKIPHLIIAKTIKGKGVSFMENQPKWHANWLNSEFMAKAIEELK
jgi:transketolase